MAVDVENPQMNYSCQKEFSNSNDFVSILLNWSVDEVTLLSIKNFRVSLLVGEPEDEESFVHYSDMSQYTQELEVRRNCCQIILVDQSVMYIVNIRLLTVIL